MTESMVPPEHIKESAALARAWHHESVTTAHLAAVLLARGEAPAGWTATLSADRLTEQLRVAGGLGFSGGSRVAIAPEFRAAFLFAAMMAALEHADGAPRPVQPNHLVFAALRLPGGARRTFLRLAPEVCCRPDVPADYGHVLGADVSLLDRTRTVAFTIETVIAAPRAELWQILSSPELMQLVNPGGEVVLEPGSDGRRGRHLHDGRTVEFEFERLEPGRTVVMTSRSGRLTGWQRCDLDDAGPRDTALVFQGSTTMTERTALVLELSQGDLTRFLRAHTEHDLAELATYCRER